VTLSEVDPRTHARKLRTNFGLESLTHQADTHDEQFGDLHASAQRSESRIVALSQQLSTSQADLESTSARFNELAGEIPADIAGLSDQLAKILNAATAEAEGVRSQARQYADTVQIEAEQHAARLITAAEAEYDSASSLRADLEAQRKQMRTDIARLREEAAVNAADILREAKDTAEEMLAGVQRDIDVQLTLAQAKLDELIALRAKIATQLRDFYDKFTDLDGTATPRGLVAQWASDSADSRRSYGAHAVAEVDLTQGTVRSIR
jgi:chromosome segregation ATPase